MADPRTVSARDVRPGMTVRMVGRGRKNRTTLHVQFVRSHPAWAGGLRVFGQNENARYGTTGQVVLDVQGDAMVEVVQA